MGRLLFFGPRFSSSRPAISGVAPAPLLQCAKPPEDLAVLSVTPTEVARSSLVRRCLACRATERSGLGFDCPRLQPFFDLDFRELFLSSRHYSKRKSS